VQEVVAEKEHSEVKVSDVAKENLDNKAVNDSKGPEN